LSLFGLRVVGHEISALRRLNCCRRR
jgi:hypothetical protein